MKTSFPNVCALLVSSLVLFARSSTAQVITIEVIQSEDKGKIPCNVTIGEFECNANTGTSPATSTHLDFYVVELLAGVNYTFQADRIDCNLNPTLTLLLNSVQVAQNSDADDLRNCTAEAIAATIGMDPIFHFQPTVNGNYTLELTGNLIPLCPADDFDYDYEIIINPKPEGVCCTDDIADPAGACGDPHFSTWKGEHYDYHGKCDLELVSDPLFANGKGLDVHIRTEILRQWSYIKHGAIRIGNDILEVEGGADENHYWFNKVYQGELTTLGGFPVKYKKANSKQHMYTIDLGNQEEIVISTFKDFVRIDFKAPKKSLYGNTVGLLADFNTGKKLGRDGFTIIEDYNDFGQEWQVLADGPKLFHEVSGRQFPGQKCVLPSELHAEEKRRRGQEKRVGGGTPNTITDTIAELACAKVSGAEHDACVSDVLITGDVDMAGAY